MFAPAGRSSKACLRLCLRCEFYRVHLEAYLSSSAVIDFDHWNSQFEKYKQRVLRWRFSKLCNASFELPGTALHSLCNLDWGIFSETLHRTPMIGGSLVWTANFLSLPEHADALNSRSY